MYTLTAPADSSVLNGPNNAPDAVGPTNNNDDFTNKSGLIPANTPPGSKINPPSVAFTNTTQNTGKNPANISILPTPPTTAGDLPKDSLVTITSGGTSATYKYDGTNFVFQSGTGTVGGTNVNILCGVNPPNITYSDPINGFDTATNQRAYGQASGGNTNNKCTGSFGDTKGLDLWTYLPSSAATATLNIIDPNSAAKLLLVKRITAINKVDVNKFVDDPNTTDDNNPNWPTPLDSSNISTYLRGAIDGGLVRPGDEVEYTIYFLSTGQNDATKVNVCDLVPSNTTFIPTAFNGLTPNDGGLSGADSGIALALGSSTPTVYLTNVDDAPDRGRFYPPSDPATPSFCGSNTNGAVVVNITRTSDFPSLPKATQPGTPANSYGFIRFRTKVK